MSKRITLTDFEIQQIVDALKKLQAEPAIKYAVTSAGIKLYDTIIEKLQPSVSKVEQ